MALTKQEEAELAALGGALSPKDPNEGVPSGIEKVAGAVEAGVRALPGSPPNTIEVGKEVYDNPMGALKAIPQEFLSGMTAGGSKGLLKLLGAGDNLQSLEGLETIAGLAQMGGSAVGIPGRAMQWAMGTRFPGLTSAAVNVATGQGLHDDTQGTNRLTSGIFDLLTGFAGGHYGGKTQLAQRKPYKPTDLVQDALGDRVPEKTAKSLLDNDLLQGKTMREIQSNLSSTVQSTGNELEILYRNNPQAMGFDDMLGGHTSADDLVGFLEPIAEARRAGAVDGGAPDTTLDGIITKLKGGVEGQRTIRTAEEVRYPKNNAYRTTSTQAPGKLVEDTVSKTTEPLEEGAKRITTTSEKIVKATPKYKPSGDLTANEWWQIKKALGDVAYSIRSGELKSGLNAKTAANLNSTITKKLNDMVPGAEKLNNIYTTAQKTLNSITPKMLREPNIAEKIAGQGAISPGIMATATTAVTGSPTAGQAAGAYMIGQKTESLLSKRPSSQIAKAKYLNSLIKETSGDFGRVLKQQAPGLFALLREIQTGIEAEAFKTSE